MALFVREFGLFPSLKKLQFNTYFCFGHNTHSYKTLKDLQLNSPKYKYIHKYGFAIIERRVILS